MRVSKFKIEVLTVCLFLSQDGVIWLEIIFVQEILGDIGLNIDQGMALYRFEHFIKL